MGFYMSKVIGFNLAAIWFTLLLTFIRNCFSSMKWCEAKPRTFQKERFSKMVKHGNKLCLDLSSMPIIAVLKIKICTQHTKYEAEKL